MDTKQGNKKKKNKNQAKKNSVPKISGQGGYYTDRVLPVMQKIFPKGSLSKFGGVAGAALGGPAAGAAGSYLGSQVSKILGFGDYTVVENSLSTVGKAIMPGEAVPEFGTRGNETRVRHREYLMDVVIPATPTAFTNLVFTINAGDSYTFPWLSSVARRYQQYRFNGLIFEFKTLSSDITSGGALGSVIMATNYDVLDAAFNSKVTMENSQFAVSAKPSCSQIHTIECAAGETPQKLFYVRSPASSAGASQDARFFDLGLFQLATSGLPGSAGTILGELWVSYDVSLFKPEIPIVSSDSARVSSGGSYTSSTPLGSAATAVGTLVSVSGQVMTFNRIGQYLCTGIVIGTGLGAFTVTGANGASVVQHSMDISTDGTLSVIQSFVTVTTPFATLTAATTASSVTGSVFRFSGYNFAYN